MKAQRKVYAMFKWVSLVFLCVVSLTAFALSNSESLSNHYKNSTSANSLLANNEYSGEMRVKTIKQGRYIGGGVASLFLGFGIGHAIQGRWKEKGWIHTTTQSIAVATLVVSLIMLDNEKDKIFQDNFQNMENTLHTNDPITTAILGIPYILIRPVGLGLKSFGEVFDSIWFKASVTMLFITSGLKVWEMIDVWMLPDSVKIISQKHNFQKSSPLKYKTKMPYSVALQWQF